jgi:flagellar biosynthesis protein FliR
MNLDFVQHALAPERWPVFALITARLTGLFLVAPLWSMTALPAPTRAALTVVLGALLLPMAPAVPLGEHVLDLPLPVAMELLIGLVIGLTAAVVTQGAAFAGEVAAVQMGLNITPALTPAPDLTESGIGQLQGMLALFVYVAVGGHHALLRGLADSLRSLPPGAMVDLTRGAQVAAMLPRALFECALSCAAPVMVTLLVVNVAMAILSRAVPQLNAMMVAFPLSIGLGLLMTGLSMPVVAGVIAAWMDRLPGAVTRVLAGFTVVG